MYLTGFENEPFVGAFSQAKLFSVPFQRKKSGKILQVEKRSNLCPFIDGAYENRDLWKRA